MKYILIKFFLTIAVTAVCSLYMNNVYAQYRLNFDGYGDYVELNAPDVTGSWTFEARIHRNGITPYSHLMTSSDGQSGIRLEQYINTNMIGITDAGVADYSFNQQAPVGAWIHLAVVCNGSTMQLFLDGVYQSTINGAIDLPMGAISGNFFGAGCLFAQLSEIRMWNTAISGTTITAYKNTPVDASHPNYNQLIHYYTFSEGAGPVLHDSKGTLDGTIHGATWSPVYAKDIEISTLVYPLATVTSFSSNNPVQVRIANVGSDTVQSDFSMAYSLDGGVPVQVTVPAATTPILPYAYLDINFPNTDLSQSGIHLFKIWHSYADDDYHANDTLVTTSSKTSIVLGGVTDFEAGNGEYIFSSGVTKVKVSYYREDIFRIQLAPTGIFQNNTDSLLAIHDMSLFTGVAWQDAGTYYKLIGGTTVLRVYKNSMKFGLYKSDNTTVIWEELSPLTFGQSTVQKLVSDPNEYFFGCGMQNGYFSHKNRSVQIENDYSNSWGVGSVSNPAPFFMSTKGYGMFRNTFKPGQYDFMYITQLEHGDTYFDSYYFSGETMKDVLEGYTYVTGRPFMIPRWGLEFGDADCYNDNGGTTMDVVDNVATQYRLNDMPGGWILPNDGYGCGYQNLEDVHDSLESQGFKMGLWSENPVSSSPFEVDSAGVGVYKLDVALVGPGYKSAFQSGLRAFEGIEDNSNKRGFIWTVAGWAGTQRFATIWSGDQSGSWDNIKMHIPTVTGAGLSAFNCATGDVDGIFGGSPSQYVRDLQWKCFTPALMVISGWAPQNKQPYISGGSYATYNREALKLKMRLTPYFYSYSRQANLTGVPTARAMVLEFPEDTVTYSTTTQYQFMSGEAFLVAPVYTAGTTRNGIYLPEAKWIDYHDGTSYNGPMTLDNYNAPLGKLPLFVKAGSIIPMYPEMLYMNQKPLDTLILDLYPSGHTAFTLFEDDGQSKAYRTGSFSEVLITLEGPVYGYAEPIIANIAAATGTYSGQLSIRHNKLDFHTPNKPTFAILNTTDTLTEYTSESAYNAAEKGWYYASQEKHGLTHVKTGPISVNQSFEVKLDDLQYNGLQENNSLEEYITVFPNPTSGKISISVSDGITISAITVCDAAGKEVKHLSHIGKVNTFMLKLSENPGFYFISIQTDKGTFVKKIEIINRE